MDALNNSIELEGPDIVDDNANEGQERVKIGQLISKNHKQVLHKFDGIIETLDDVIKNGNCSMGNVYDGPEIRESDKLLSEALTEHFKPKGWHFVTHNAFYSDGGKAAGRILKKNSCLPFFQ